MKPVKVLTCLALFLGLSTFSAVTTARTLSGEGETQATEASAKTAQLLQQSGYTHRKTGDQTWVIERSGEKKGLILVATGEDFVVVGIVVTTKDNMRPSTDLNVTLLKLNHSLDYVKTGFDDDNDLFVRIEERIRIVDLREFKAIVEAVIAAADTIYEKVTPFLVKP